MARTTGYATFGDCAVHGEAISEIFESTTDEGQRAWMCNICSKQSRVRADGMPSFVKTVVSNVRKIRLVNRNGFNETAKPCNGKCTSGKTSCDCRCGGRCHGAGRCLGGHN